LLCTILPAQLQHASLPLLAALLTATARATVRGSTIKTEGIFHLIGTVVK
jgi:hypothetical protein